jgi:5-formyltetrahydrofolate cyclo-ligase
MTIENQQRSQLRTQLRAARNSLSPQAQLDASNKLKFACTSLKDNVSTVALYLANDGELNPNLAAEYLWQNNVTTLLPVIDPTNKGHLVFQYYRSNTSLPENKYGIPEPKYCQQDIVELTHIDVIFMPLVGFDAVGNRLGMGGGYYDRTLANHQILTRRPLLVGLAHNCQQVNHLPFESWDIPLDMILTPSQKLITKHGEKITTLPL